MNWKIKLASLIVTFGFCNFTLAASVPPVMHDNGKIETNGPSLPIGFKDDTTNAHRIAESEDSTGVDALWVTTSAASIIQICDAAGECVDFEQFNATHAVALYSMLVSAGMYAYDGAAMARLTQSAAGDALAAAATGLTTVALTHFYDGANQRRWLGATMGNDNVVSTTVAPWVGSFLMGYDGVTWDRVTTHAAGDALSAAQAGVDVLSHNLFYDGTNYRRWLGAQMNVDDVVATTYAPWTGSFLMGYDGVTWDRLTTHAAGDALAAAQPGLDVLSHNLYYDGTNYRRWLGAQMGNDDVVATTAAPWVGSFLMGYDGATWDRVTTHAAGDALAAAQPGLDVLSHNLFYDGTNHRRWLGAQMNADNVAATVYAPWTGSFLMGYDGTDWGRVATDANGDLTVNQTTANPGYSRTQDGDSTVLQDVLDANADNLALTLNPAVNACVMYGYDGATLDMARTSATGGIVIYVENWPSSEDQANNRQEVMKVEIETQEPAKETTVTAGGAAATVVFDSREILNDANWCIYYSNVGANPLTDADIQVSPEGVTWISLVWTTCDALAASSACVYCVSGNAYRYIRGRAIAGVGVETTLDVFYTSNKG